MTCGIFWGIAAHGLTLSLLIIIPRFVSKLSTNLNTFTNMISYTSATLKEELIFPVLSQKMDFSGEVDSHKTIHAALEELITAIDVARNDHSKFKPEEMHELMSKLREPLVCLQPLSVISVHALLNVRAVIVISSTT